MPGSSSYAHPDSVQARSPHLMEPPTFLAGGRKDSLCTWLGAVLQSGMLCFPLPSPYAARALCTRVALKKGSAGLQQHLLSTRGMLRRKVTKLLWLSCGEEPFTSLAPISVISNNLTASNKPEG